MKYLYTCTYFMRYTRFPLTRPNNQNIVAATRISLSFAHSPPLCLPSESHIAARGGARVRGHAGHTKADFIRTEMSAIIFLE